MTRVDNTAPNPRVGRAWSLAELLWLAPALPRSRASSPADPALGRADRRHLRGLARRAVAPRRSRPGPPRQYAEAWKKRTRWKCAIELYSAYRAEWLQQKDRWIGSRLTAVTARSATAKLCLANTADGSRRARSQCATCRSTSTVTRWISCDPYPATDCSRNYRDVMRHAR
jgi:hypothetical protein